MLCAKAVTFYAHVLITGYTLKGGENIEKAYKILTAWLDRLEYEDPWNTVSAVLSRIGVKKGLFGPVYYKKPNY